MGSQVSVGKCLLFSTGKLARAQMRVHIWPFVNKGFKVVCTARDLGAQANFGKKASGAVTSGRMRKGAKHASHVRTLPCTWKP
eukprot:8816956-Alexandrium_andersonii.AAC.1